MAEDEGDVSIRFCEMFGEYSVCIENGNFPNLSLPIKCCLD